VPTDYEHHIFISYAHSSTWTPWVRQTFAPKLRAFLEIEVGRTEIFVDDQIQTGARWAALLKRKVACSKLMMPLMSATYFQRDWCRREMALMLEREKVLGLISHDDNYGLVIPVRLGDGNMFPELIGKVQYFDFEEYADPDLPPATPRASDFNRELKKLSKTIANTLPHVPRWDSSWNGLTGDPFFDDLAAKPLPLPGPPRLLV
jgi:hypothetical protein